MKAGSCKQTGHERIDARADKEISRYEEAEAVKQKEDESPNHKAEDQDPQKDLKTEVVPQTCTYGGRPQKVPKAVINKGGRKATGS